MGASFQRTKSEPAIASPFGELPFRQAGGYANRFARPLSMAFGLGQTTGGRGRRQARFEDMLSQATGPTADYIRSTRAMLPGIQDQAARAGAEIGRQAPIAFNTLQGQISRMLEQLPGLQSAAMEGVSGGKSALDALAEIRNRLMPASQGAYNTARWLADTQATMAQNAAQQAQSPFANRATFQETLRRAMEGSRAGLAGRGLLDQGMGAGVEQDLIMQLALDAQRNEGAIQAAAQQGLGTAAATQGVALDYLRAPENVTGQYLAGLNPYNAAIDNARSLLGTGVDAASMGLGAVGDFATLLQQQYGIPMQAAQGIFAILTGQQDPTTALLQLTAPTVGQRSHSIAQQAGI